MQLCRIAVMVVVTLPILVLPSTTACASEEYRYIEAENPTTTEGSGLREEGFTSWMRHPSHAKVMVLGNTGWLEYEVKDLQDKPYHLFCRGLAWETGADVDLFWDGKKVGRPAYAVPGTALKWSREVGVVPGSQGLHKLRIVSDSKNTQAPYIDVLLLTTQTGYQPGDEDQDFQSFITPLPLLHLKTQRGDATIVPEPGAEQSTDAAVEILDAAGGDLDIGRNEFTFTLKSSRDVARSLELAVRAGDGEESRIPINLPPATNQQARITCEVNTPGKVALRLRLVESGKDLLNGSYALMVPDPVTVSLDEYAYTAGTKQAVWQARFSSRPEVTREVGIAVSVHRHGQSQPLDRRTLKAEKPVEKTAFSIANLSPGRYHLVSRFTRKGRTMLEDKRDFILFRPSPLEAWEPVKRTETRGDTICLNGKPFLGRLLYHAAPDEKTRSQGFNLVQCSGGDPDPRESIGKHLDACAKVGLWGTVALFNNNYFLPGDHFDLEHLRDAVLRFKDHPAVWAWDLVDEPDVRLTPERVAEAAKLIRELDPNHIVWVNLCQPQHATDYLDSQDLWSFDFYPLPTLGPFAYMQWLRISDEKLRGKRPLGSALQTYAYDGSRMPTPDELRCISYLHLIHGYKWLGFYSYYDAEPYGCLSRDPVLWSFTRALNSELREMRPVILDPAPFTPVEADAGTDKVQAAQKEVNGKRYLVAINGTSGPLHVRLKTAGKSARLLFEAERTMKIKDGELEDDLMPCGVHVYLVTH